MEIEKLKDMLRTESLYKDKATLEIMDLCMEAATALEQLQAENDRLKEIVYCYCDMCIDQDGVLWCQSCDEKCDYCIHPKEETNEA